MPTIYLRPASALPDPCPVCRVGRRIVGRDGDTGIHGCGPAHDDAISCVEGADVHAARSEVKRPAVLAAMASVPKWLRAYTLGRPAWSSAAGDELQRLLWAALEERKHGEPGPARAAYFAAMDARWGRCLERGVLAPGQWVWAPHEGIPNGLVPDGATIVCTCRPAQDCHIDALGPWLVRSGWTVVGRDGKPVEAV